MERIAVKNKEDLFTNFDKKIVNIFTVSENTVSDLNS